MAQPNEHPRPWSRFTSLWPVALSLLTAVIAGGAVMLHFIGANRHRHFLRHWAIDSDLFPKTADWILINGYYGVVDRLAVTLTAITDNLQLLVPAALLLGLYVFILLTPVSGKPGKPPAWLMRQPDWLRRLTRQVVLTTLVVCMVPGALFLLTAFMVFPAVLGETAGKASAESAAAEYSKGCQQSKISCVEVKSNGDVIATGFLLDSSPSHIAIFDTLMQRGRVLAMDKFEIVSMLPPKSK